MDTMEGFNVYEIEDYFLQDKSFRGKDIENWIKHSLDNSNVDVKVFAKFLNKNFYKKKNKPHPDQYYYFKRVGEMRAHLIRDKVLCPIIEEYAKKNVSLKEFKKLLREIRFVEKQIRNKNNKYDLDKLNKINNLLGYRIMILMNGEKFSFDQYKLFNRYRRIQFYSIFRDKLLDLNVIYYNIKIIDKMD